MHVHTHTYLDWWYTNDSNSMALCTYMDAEAYIAVYTLYASEFPHSLHYAPIAHVQNGKVCMHRIRPFLVMFLTGISL